MDEEQGNEYIQELEKLMSSEVAATFWAPTMDILAIVTFDNLLEGYRISFRAQRFFQIEESQAIESLCFSPDSQLISYSLLDGSIKIILTETGEKVVAVEGLGIEEIQSLNFVPFTHINPHDFMPFRKNSIEAKLIPNISPHKNCNKNAIIKINYFNQLKEDFTCLLTTEKKKTWLFLNGFIPMAAIDYDRFFQGKAYRALYSHLTGQKLYSIMAEEIESTYSLQLLTFETKQIMERSEDIVKYNCLMANMTEIFNFIDTTYSAMEAATRDIIRQYNSKINLIDDGESGDVSPCQELMHYLTIGLASKTLNNFFTKEVYDAKHLQKLDETLTSLFAQLHDVIIESVQNGLERAFILLEKLSNYSKIDKKFGQFGLRTERVREIEEKVRRLYILGEMILVESTEAKFNIRNLLVWLNKSAIKSSQENQTEIQNSKSFLNKYTVDYSRLFKFLSIEDNFKLHNLLDFFRKTEDFRPMVIQNPEFRILTKGAPHDQGAKGEGLDELERELGVEDIEIAGTEQPMESEYSFQSLKIEMKSLLKCWKSLAEKPAQLLGDLICKTHNLYHIGKVELSEMFDFTPKFITSPSSCLLYYIEQGEPDKLIRYDCKTQLKSYLYSSTHNILSVTVAEEIICILEEKESCKKVISQIVNEKFDGGELMSGKVIDSCQGDLQVNSSWRGLNSLVVDKTKLVIFD